MRRNKEFILLTLASNGEAVVIPKSNIAFAMASTGESENGISGDKYTRIFLKEVLIDDEARWVDVRETPEEIARK